MKRVMLTVLLSALATGVPTYAHHSFAADYFEDQKVSIEGDIVQFEYRNPHSWVHVMVTDENGKMQAFSAEWANPGRLTRDGLTAETLKPGDRVIITGSPGRHPSDHRIRLTAIERRADGWKWPVARVSR